MLTLAKLKATRGSKPYSQPVKLAVCGVGPRTTYTTENGERKETVVIGAADNTAAMKIVVYDMKKMPMMAVDKTVMLLNYISKSTPEACIVVTNKTRVMVTAQIEVSPTFKAEAEHIANPPPAEVVSIMNVKTSPAKTLVSLRGKIVAEELTKTVQVKGSDVQVKSVTLRQGAEDIKLSLWRNLSEENLIGQYIEVQNVVTNLFRDEVSVSTTARTTIIPCEQPSTTKEGVLVAFTSGEIAYEVMINVDEEYETIEVPVDILTSVIEGDLISGLENKLNSKCKIIANGVQCESFQFIS